jgi:hypothetical protein
MITLFIVHVGNKFARLGREVRETWLEAQRLRRTLPGPTEE